MSGPFFVKGAEAGDTLAVSLKSIVPSRKRGYTRNVLAANVVDPEHARLLPNSRTLPKGEWHVNTKRRVVTLHAPRGLLGALSLPLEAFPGCFGVAPALGEHISTATSGPHGGNMDWNGFQAGVTVYFPVSVAGALFFIGDGHARQGDGEMSGTGIEISIAATFSARVIKGWKIGWPRGESRTHIFTVGNARPLDQATQHATSEMAGWLTEQYGLDQIDIGLLMGQAVEYELGNMYDPAYTMVCKMPKNVLAKLKRLQ